MKISRVLRVCIRASFFSGLTSSGYWPNAYAQNLNAADKHKNVYAFLAELNGNSALGHKGQLVVVLLTRYAAFDANNAVYFDANAGSNTTAASVFRVKGQLLSKRQV